MGDLARLGQHELVRLPQVEARISRLELTRDAGYEASRQEIWVGGGALRDTLAEAIRSLKPEAALEDVTDTHWRSYIILHEQYGLGRPADQVADHLIHP